MRLARLSLVLLLVAPAARAADGVIEINQARAEAGGVTATDTPGFPVTLGVPGSYRLTSNLDVTRAPVPADTVAVLVEAAGVTLDLGGFSIVGPTTCSGFPLVCAPAGSGHAVRSLAERTVVRNGHVRGAGGAGFFSVIPQATVEGLSVSHCASHGIWLPSDTRIIGNIVKLNGGFGIIGGGLIQGNVVSANGEGGIAGSDAQVSDNVVENNFGVGISQAVLVVRNVVRGNSGLGLSLVPNAAFGSNFLSDNNGAGNPPQTSGGIQIAPNVCGTDTICP
jgi:hypothetical protein